MNSTSSAWLREQGDQSSSKWAVPEKSQSQRRPSGSGRTSLIFDAYTQHMRDDAQWLLSKPGDDSRQVERWLMWKDVDHWQAELSVFRQPEPCAKEKGMQLPVWKENTYLGKQRKSGKDTGGKVEMQPNLHVTLQGDKGEDKRCRLKCGPVLVPQRVLNRKIICPLLVSAS